MQFRTIVLNTFREIWVKKLFWVNMGITLFVVGGMACWGFDEEGASVLWYRLDSASGTWSTANHLFRSLISSMIIRDLLITLYIGWIGTVIGLVCTAGIFPAMMEKGSIDCLLARPLSRWKIFLAKYVGSLFYMAAQAAVFVVLAILVMGTRWNVWFPGLLWAIPLLVLMFSYLYCVCVAFGLWTRNGLASLLLTIGFWFLIWVPQIGHETAQALPEMTDFPRVKKALAVAKWAVPNTTEIPRLAERLIDATDPLELSESELLQHPQLDPKRMRQALEYESKAKFTPWYYSVGSSLLFEAVVLLLAGWRFSKKDF